MSCCSHTQQVKKMGSSETQFCRTFRPTRAEFSRPFCEYVQDLCRQYPDTAMFKVVPPKGWSPRKGNFPQLQDLRIQTPIKQHVFGTGGAFRCLFEEQKGLSAADYKKLASGDSHKTPPKGHRQDDLLERAFWSSVTINPPLYGADTPTSFFDEQLEYGWNLRDLKDLLTQYNVPAIPGVTTPMTYFGMWKSFFSWHVEDIDLYSINYLHFGAPKVWYCVSPKDRSKFEDMAKGLFPELHNICPAFLRHKDILLSPKTLRNHHINYVQAKQEAGEFIVLNAGAYHSGFNIGFNCAEAVNFATADWLPAGKSASHCTCTALPDHVTLDMKIFSHGPRVSPRLKAALEKAAEDTEPESEEESGNEAETSGDDSQAEEEMPVMRTAMKNRRRGPVERPGQRRKQKSRPLNVMSKRSPPKKKAVMQKLGSSKPAQPIKAAALAVRKEGKVAKRSPAAKHTSARPAASLSPVDRIRQNPFASASHNSTLAKLAAARGAGSKRLAGQAAAPPPEEKRRRRRAQGTQPAGDPAADPNDANSGPVRRAFEWVRSLMTGQQPSDMEIKSPAATSDVLDEKPCAIVGEDETTGRKCFHLVQRLKRKARRKGHQVVRWLREEADGVFRPTGEVWEEADSALVPVRSQPWPKTALRPPGYRLLTLRSRILDTELID